MKFPNYLQGSWESHSQCRPPAAGFRTMAWAYRLRHWPATTGTGPSASADPPHQARYSCSCSMGHKTRSAKQSLFVSPVIAMVAFARHWPAYRLRPADLDLLAAILLFERVVVPITHPSTQFPASAAGTNILRLLRVLAYARAGDQLAIRGLDSLGLTYGATHQSQTKGPYVRHGRNMASPNPNPQDSSI